MARIEGKFWGYAPLTLGIIGAVGCVAGIIGMALGRDDVFYYGFFPGLVLAIAAFIWDRSRYSLMVVKVTGKRKQFVETVRTEDHRGYSWGKGKTTEKDVYEFWLSTNLGPALVGERLYGQVESGGKYEVMAQIIDGDLFISGLRKPKRVR